ncbi:MAG: hypothetical protein M5U05_01230 [Anaerolineales bacterium]|nr:hypothetical protein [Anaerolineales bacterium]
MGWIILILFIIIVLIVWIALTRNSKDSPTDLDVHGHAPVAEAAPTEIETPSRVAQVELAEASVEPAAEARAAAPATSIKLDDLTIVEGIGPKVSSLLNEAGIMNLGQLAKAKLGPAQRGFGEIGLAIHGSQHLGRASQAGG